MWIYVDLLAGSPVPSPALHLHEEFTTMCWTNTQPFLVCGPFWNTQIFGCTLEGTDCFKAILNNLIVIHNYYYSTTKTHSVWISIQEFLDNSLIHYADIIRYLFFWCNLLVSSITEAKNDNHLLSRTLAAGAWPGGLVLANGTWGTCDSEKRDPWEILCWISCLPVMTGTMAASLHSWG